MAFFLWEKKFLILPFASLFALYLHREDGHFRINFRPPPAQSKLFHDIEDNKKAFYTMARSPLVACLLHTAKGRGGKTISLCSGGREVN